MNATVVEGAVLQASGLVKEFPVRSGVFARRTGAVHAVSGVDLVVRPGRTVSLVGESGCGKSTTGRMLARLLPATRGRIWLDGTEITGLSGEELRRRRRDVQIMFQDPYSSLSPRMTVADIVAEPLRVQGWWNSDGRQRVVELLQLVGLRADHANRYAHEFSGGQRQRIGLARALALRPKVIILDEPVSALDVSIQAQVVNLLQDLQHELGLAYVFVSHNLAVVRQVSDEVAVMYLGRIVEQGPREEIYTAPQHPYTQALLSAVPSLDPRTRRERLVLTGELPNARTPPSGCRFRTRCPRAEQRCADETPLLTVRGRPGHLTACHFPDDAAVDGGPDPVGSSETGAVSGVGGVGGSVTSGRDDAGSDSGRSQRRPDEER